MRGAVVADPGWTFVVADAAQLEPRVLAAMSGDAAMARAGRAQDMYQGMVDAGAVETRPQAKYGMLGAIYGGTTGESGRMRPRIERAFPRAMAYVEEAARAGERGEVVSTWLGRSSPPRRERGLRRDRVRMPKPRRSRNDAARAGAGSPATSWCRAPRPSGRCAGWARCAGGSGSSAGETPATPPLTARPHLVFFLHDELIVHTPVEPLAEQVADALCASRRRRPVACCSARRRSSSRCRSPIVDSYADAK